MLDKIKQYIEESEEERISRLVADNLMLVKYIISRMEIHLPSGMDKEDLVSIGNFGLIEASRNYDSNKNAKFQTYAYIKIRGSILDELRKSSFGGQAIVRKQKHLMDVHEQLVRELGRVPEEKEFAIAMNISEDKLAKMLDETSGAYLLSLDNFAEDEDNGRYLDFLTSDEDDYLDELIKNEEAEFLVAVLANLPKNERLVLSLYYEQELSLKEISLIMNLTESRISQIHKKAILYIRSSL